MAGERGGGTGGESPQETADALVLSEGTTTYAVPLDVVRSFSIRAEWRFDPAPDPAGWDLRGVAQVTYQPPGPQYGRALGQLAAIPNTTNTPDPWEPPWDPPGDPADPKDSGEPPTSPTEMS